MVLKKNCRRYGWSCIRFHFFIQASFMVDPESWYCVTNGDISVFLLVVLFRSLNSLSVNFVSDCWFRLSKFVGRLCPSSVFLKFELFSSKVVSEEFFRRILKASPLTNPFFTCSGRFPSV